MRFSEIRVKQIRVNQGLGVISFFPVGDLPDRHVTPIAMVFDELKDYLSESDLSLDYKIARSRSKKKKVYRNSRIFANSTEYSHQGMYQIDTVHRGAFCQSSFQ